MKLKPILTAILFSLFPTVAMAQNSPTSCPGIEVTGPSGITRPGEAMVFQLRIPQNIEKRNLNFEWKVSTTGKLIDGQGTDMIRVVSDAAGQNVTATVTVKGLPKDCTVVYSELAGVAPAVISCPVEDYGDIAWPDEQARLDNLQIQINQNPKSQAFLLINVKEDETLEATKKHIARILKHLKWRDRDFDLSRMNFGIQKADHHSTRFYVVPEGEEMPKCGEECVLLNGKQISP